MLSSFSGISFHKDEYREFSRSMETLNKGLAEYYEGADQGRKPLAEKDILALRKLYTNALESAKAFTGLKNKMTTRADDKRIFVARNIQRMLAQDLSVLSRVKEEQEVTLVDCQRQANSLHLDMTDSKSSSVGESLSQRIPVAYEDSNGSVQKGFFTKHTTLMNHVEVFGKYMQKYPEGKELWNTLYRTYPVETGLRDQPSWNLFNAMKDDRFFLRGEYGAYLKKNPSMKPVVEAFRREYAQGFLYGMAIRADSGSCVGERNCAMSDVAALLKKGNLLARAERASLTNNGETVHGIFMKEAVGTDAYRSRPGDPIEKWAEKPMYSADALRQIADLQVIDFICGNTDRHLGNMLYQFNTDNPDQPVMTGIMGIDNDMSFGTIMIRPNEKGQTPAWSVPINRMGVISQSMAERVLAINEADMEKILKSYNFSEMEVNAAKTRLKDMQTAVKEGAEWYQKKNVRLTDLDPDHLKVIPDNEFGKFDIEKLSIQKPGSKTNGNYFSRCGEPLAGEVKKKMKLMKNMAVQNPQEAEKEAEKGTISYAGAVRGVASAIKEPNVREQFLPLKEQLDALKASARSNSPEFEEMHEALTKLMQMTDTENYKDGKQAPTNAVLREAVVDVQKKAEKYISLKRTVPRTEKGRERVLLAREMVDSCVNTDREMAGAILNRDKKLVPTYRETMTNKIQNMQKEASKALWSENTSGSAGLSDSQVNKVTDMIYLSILKPLIGQEGNAKMINLLKPQVMKKRTAEIRPLVQDWIKTISPEAFKNAMHWNENSALDSGVKFCAKKMNMNQRKKFRSEPRRESIAMPASNNSKKNASRLTGMA